MDQTPNGKGKNSGYRTYLLTCWRERVSLAGTTTWRFRLETPLTGQRRLFAMLEDAIAWVDSELNDDAENEEVLE